MKKIVLMLLAMCALAACENGGGDTPKDITVTGGSTNQTVYADETSVNQGEGIRFTTTGAWHAEVEELTKTVGWLELSQTGGDKAGEYTLKITLQENTTGADRMATVKIICGDTTITITVEQKGIKKGEDPTPDEPEDPDPEKPQPDNGMLISKIVVKEKTSDGSYKYLRETDFSYDGQKRLVKVVSTRNGSADGRKELTYDYVTNKMTEIFQEGSFTGGVWEYEKTDVVAFSLNSDGYVLSADGKSETKQKGVIQYTSEYNNDFTYTDDGYVAKLDFKQVDYNADGSVGEEGGQSKSEYIWQNGNMMYQQERDSKIKYTTWEYNALSNNSNLDLNYMISDSDDLDYTMAFSKLGKLSQNRISKEYYASASSGKPQPSRLFSSASNYRSESDEHVAITYETNSENGSVTKVYVSYDNWNYLYEITY